MKPITRYTTKSVGPVGPMTRPRLSLRTCVGIMRESGDGWIRAMREGLDLWWDEFASYYWGKQLGCGCVTALGKMRSYVVNCPEHWGNYWGEQGA